MTPARDFAIRIAHRLGLEVYRWPPPGLQRHLQSLLKTYHISAVIDVGANEGQFGSTVRRLGYNGKIISFEPAPPALEILTTRARRDRSWMVRGVALADQTGEVTLNVSESSDLSSILPYNSYLSGRFPEARVNTKVNVPSYRLDDLWQDLLTDSERVLLKIDTQGYDMKVFNGAASHLPSISIVMMELAVIPGYDGVDNELLHSVGALRAAGFELSGLYPVHLDAHLRVDEMDGLFVRPKAH